ncbi:hypothetical protein RF11_02700 [Thelohanellus kitauei]|uniref:Uncharacterized protein n=1 Tax=Thelohanellus kitauei TaxID=669202 RepID=A0A0C2MLP7_THEKT|nr:hypothetical protein RF11_02700 [Thelohanellus kitauei]
MDYNKVYRQQNQRACEDYIRNTHSNDSSTQMEEVRHFISHFVTQNDPEVDLLFIQFFPIELYGEFFYMSEGQTNIDRYQEKIILFFDVFTFIYRNPNLVTDSKAKCFILRFLKLIQTCDPITDYNLDTLITSISVCVSYDPNKVMFINENGMFNIYNYFKISGTTLVNEFGVMCHQIYNLDRTHFSSLIPAKLTKSVNQIMAVSTSDQKEFQGLMITVLGMLSRLKLLDDVEFDVTQLFDISISVFINSMHEVRDSLLLVHLQKYFAPFSIVHDIKLKSILLKNL